MEKIIQPVINLAEEGFAVSPRLASLIANDAERLSRFPTTKHISLTPMAHQKPKAHD